MQEQGQLHNNISPGTKLAVTKELQEMLHTHNSYVRSFKCALDYPNIEDYRIVINEAKKPSEEHSRRFNAPECNEITIILADEQHERRDIVLTYRDSSLINIHECHRSYDALQYPLLFVYGEDGCYFERKETCKAHYAYRFMIRKEHFNHIQRSGDLFQQCAVDMFAKIERLRFIRLNQTKLRVTEYIHLRDHMNNDGDGRQLGQLCILPSSFTGGPRYMHERTQDAMTYVRAYGTPDLFITFTCNPKWKEIMAELLPNQSYHARPDLVARVFRHKLIKLMNLITKSHIFGDVRCYMYTIEWQKRGLPHAHILIWLITKIHANQVDSIISAEIPDPSKDEKLHSIVTTNMIHGPCGSLNLKSPCMKDNKCTKRYPRLFLDETVTGEDGYRSYRRRQPGLGGFTATLKNKTTVDNRWVVPYNPLLSKTFDAHINVEFCNSVKSIKYICKYETKGADAATFVLLQDKNLKDEVSEYQNGRYISSSEAFWRVFGFPIHERYPAIVQLAVHLPNGQRVVFREDKDQAMSPRETTLTAFFKLCQEDEFARTRLYHEVLSYYTWKSNSWHRRKEGSRVNGHPGIKFDGTLGRVYVVHPNQQ